MAEFVKRFSLTGKNALVTGASKGIGSEICGVLADAGADIVAVARDHQGLLEAKAAVEAVGRRCLVIEADLATVEGPRAAARTALEAWGVIDILVNNAGTTAVESILDTRLENWDRLMARQPARALPAGPGAGAQDDREARRQDRQCQLADQRGRARQARRLHGLEEPASTRSPR